MSIFDPREKTGNFWEDHKPLIIVSIVCVIFWLLGGILSYKPVYVTDAEHAGEPVAPMWSSEYWWGSYVGEAALSVMAEPFGVLVPVLITALFLHRKKEEDSVG